MYAALWRRVPGGFVSKIFAMLGLGLAALALLFFVVFPVVEPHLPWNDVTVNTPPLTPTVSAPASPSAAGSGSSPAAAVSASK